MNKSCLGFVQMHLVDAKDATSIAQCANSRPYASAKVEQHFSIEDF